MSSWENTIRSELRDYREKRNTSTFTLDEFREFATDRLQAQFPENNHVDESLRRNLQEFRDRDEIEFLGDGEYRILELEGDRPKGPDNRRMTTDRFFGGVRGRLHTLRSMLRYVTEETPSQSELIAWIRSNTDAESESTTEKYLSFQRSIGLLERTGDEYRLTSRGSEFADSGNRDVIVDALFENVKGFETILDVLESGPTSGDEIQSALQTQYPDYQLPWDVVERHIEWLQALEAVTKQGGTYELTDYGKGLLKDIGPADDYRSVSEAESDITNRLKQTSGASNWLSDQLGETVVRDWTDALRGLNPGSVVSVERATKLKQITRLYGDAEERLQSQAETLQSGSLNRLSPAKTLFVVFLRELQTQAGEQSNANQVKIKVTLNGEYEIDDAEELVVETEDDDDGISDDEASFEFEYPNHPLVKHLRDNDVSIYKFTAPPDYWLTTFEYAALSFEKPDREAWEELDAGDVILFHSRTSPSWEELTEQDSGLIGGGIVRAKTTKGDDESWWYDEHEGGPKGDSFPLLVAFKRLFVAGQLDGIDFTKQVIDKSPDVVSAELDSLTSNLLPFERADALCREVAEKGFPRHRVVESLGESDEISKGVVLADALAHRVVEAPPVALHKSFDGELPASILDGLYFPDDEGRAVIEQIQVALQTGKHLILTGPPGTGKTEIARRVCEYLESEYPYLFSGSQVTTATADWSTFDTVGGYMPNGESGSGNELEFSPGLILNRFKDRGDAIQLNEPLVIDELNRADIDKAFGQLFTVLSGQSVQLPYTRDGSEIALQPADATVNTPSAHEYVIPSSWPLFATLNTYDKTSLYEMSYAFMRRFAFIRVPAPSLPSDSSDLVAVMEEYAQAWDIDVNQTALMDVGQVWRATNTAVEDRSIGPAVVKDILSFVGGHTTGSQSMWLTRAVISFICPQLEGVPKREKILRQIATVGRIDDEMLDQAARDMLQVALITDE